MYDWDSRQQDIYNQTARPIIDAVLDGYNGTFLGLCIFMSRRYSRRWRLMSQALSLHTVRPAAARLSQWREKRNLQSLGASSRKPLTTSSLRLPKVSIKLTAWCMCEVCKTGAPCCQSACTGQSTNQSITESINQPINQSIKTNQFNQSIQCLFHIRFQLATHRPKQLSPDIAVTHCVMSECAMSDARLY